MSRPDQGSLQILIDKLAKVEERAYLSIIENIVQDQDDHMGLVDNRGIREDVFVDRLAKHQVLTSYNTFSKLFGSRVRANDARGLVNLSAIWAIARTEHSQFIDLNQSGRASISDYSLFKDDHSTSFKAAAFRAAHAPHLGRTRTRMQLNPQMRKAASALSDIPD